MKKGFKRILIGIGSIAVGLYSLFCIYLYSIQETILFKPYKVPVYYKYGYTGRAKEQFLKTPDGAILNSIIVNTDSAKGVIFCLHGNGGSLANWDQVAPTYTALHYDFFITDYRDYGKSTGTITSERQLYDDAQLVYDELRKSYPEEKITILGYSLGTGVATWLAAHNHPKRLILQAPYYNMSSLMKEHFPYIPTFILKYKLPTNELLPKVKCHILIFHGDCDGVINYRQSIQLKPLLKQGDEYMLLKGQDHNSINANEEYLKVIERVL